MKVYVLRIAPDESDGEGTDCDEWFVTLRDARHRRENLIAQVIANVDDMRYGSDFMIESFTVAKLPRDDLILALLNRRAWSEDGPFVEVPAWKRVE